MKALKLMMVSLMVVLGDGVDLSAKVVNGFMDGDGSKKVQYKHKKELQLLIKKQFSDLDNFELKLIKRKDGNLLFNSLSIIQDRNKGLRDFILKVNKTIDAGEKSELYQDLENVLDFLDNLSGLKVEGVTVVESERVLKAVMTRAVSLYSMPKYVKVDYSRILLALEKPEVYYDTFRYYFKMSIKDEEIYKKILKASKVVGKNGSKIINIGGKIVTAVSVITEAIDTLAYHKTTSNGVNYENAKNFIESYSNSSKLNLWGHYDGALTLNTVLRDLGVSFDTVRMMSTGTADSKVWGNGKNFSLKEDIKAASVFGSMDAKYSSFMTGDWKDWLIATPHTKMIFNERYYDDPWANDFLKAYMGSSKYYGNTLKVDAINNYIKNYLALKKLDQPINNLWLNPAKLNKTTIEQGEKIRVEVTQAYDGNQRSSQLVNPKICFRLTSRESWSNRYLIREASGGAYSNIGSDKKYEKERVYFLIPNSIQPGNYYLGMKADCNNQIKETRENDNYQYVPIRVVKKKGWDDIYLSNSRIDKTTLKPSERVYVRTRVHYRGTNTRSNHPPVYISYYISKSRYFNKSNAIYLDYDYSSIGTDDLYDDEREKIKIPSNFSETAYIHIVADNKNGVERIKESNERNNIATLKIKIKSSSSSSSESAKNDFYLTNSRVSDSSVYRGQRIRIYTDVRYSGNQRYRDLGRVYTSYYIACGHGLEYLDYDSSSVGTDDRCDGESERVRIPRSCNTGTGFIVIWTDNKRGVSKFKETSEGDNYQFVRIRIR